MAEPVTDDVSDRQGRAMMAELAEELTEMFRAMQKDAMALLARAQVEGWQADRFVMEFGKMFEEENERKAEVQVK